MVPMAIRKEFLVTAPDLRYVGIGCKSCGTETVLDMASKYEPENMSQAGFVPRVCATCGEQFDAEVKKALDRFKAVYGALAVKRDSAVVFHVDLNETN